MELVPAPCQNCGAQLSVDPASVQVECPFCSTAYAVKVSGTTVGLRRVTQSLGRTVDESAIATPAELMISRLRQDCSNMREQVERSTERLRADEGTQGMNDLLIMATVICGGLSLLILVLSVSSGNSGSLVYGGLFLALTAGGAFAAKTRTATHRSGMRDLRARISGLEAEVAQKENAIDDLLERRKAGDE